MSIVERRYYVDGPYGQLHVREAAPANGAGSRPALVCFHQSPISGAQFLPFQRVMAEDRRVLCPDTPGYGRSDGPTQVPTMVDYAGAFAVMAVRIGLADFDVLGFHTGSQIAVELAASRPDLVRKVVLSSLALFNAEELARNRKGFGGPRPLFTDPDYIGRYYREQVTDGLPGISPERRLELFTARIGAGETSWYGPEAVFTHPTEARLPAVTQPVLLLALRDTLAENTRRAANFLKRATVVDRPDIHGPPGWDSHPADIAAEVRRFLDAA
ncbi:MAG: alpha/beta hydrolase [Alphaproteobacteria bacterium]|nr:alpha/beta hydrolase [Alphaproteobacteria bacterium]